MKSSEIATHKKMNSSAHQALEKIRELFIQTSKGLWTTGPHKVSIKSYRQLLDIHVCKCSGQKATDAILTLSGLDVSVDNEICQPNSAK